MHCTSVPSYSKAIQVSSLRVKRLITSLLVILLASCSSKLAVPIYEQSVSFRLKFDIDMQLADNLTEQAAISFRDWQIQTKEDLKKIPEDELRTKQKVVLNGPLVEFNAKNYEKFEGKFIKKLSTSLEKSRLEDNHQLKVIEQIVESKHRNMSKRIREYSLGELTIRINSLVLPVSGFSLIEAFKGFFVPLPGYVFYAGSISRSGYANFSISLNYCGRQIDLPGELTVEASSRSVLISNSSTILLKYVNELIQTPDSELHNFYRSIGRNKRLCS